MLKFIVFLLVSAAFLVSPLAAIDEHPLLQMLALVPDNLASRAWLTYTDYRAMGAARGLEESPTIADFDARTATARTWIAASMGLSTGIDMRYFFNYVSDMPQLVGFGFFDIDRAVIFGQPPSTGTILMGNFDADAIAEAYTAREFTEEQVSGVTVWCGPNGCDSGSETNLSSREPGNPFGGELGRKEPLAVLPNGMLANSADFAVVEDIIEAAQDPAESLVTSPEYRAMADALTSNGELIQVQFINPADVAFGDFATLDEGNSIQEITADFGQLPIYSLAALADSWEGDTFTAWIALAYSDAETAQTAVDELSRRLKSFVSFRTQQSLSEMLEDSDAQLGQPTIYESDGQAIALFPVHYPIPPNEVSEDGIGYPSSSMVFRLLMSELYARGLYLLATNLPE